MNLDFEISRVDCISKENYFSHFNIKNTHQSLESSSSGPTFSARKTLSARSIPMPLVWFIKTKIFFLLYSVDNPFNNTRRSSYRRTALNS